MGPHLFHLLLPGHMRRRPRPKRRVDLDGRELDAARRLGVPERRAGAGARPQKAGQRVWVAHTSRDDMRHARPAGCTRRGVELYNTSCWIALLHGWVSTANHVGLLLHGWVSTANQNGACACGVMPGHAPCPTGAAQAAHPTTHLCFQGGGPAAAPLPRPDGPAASLSLAAEPRASGDCAGCLWPAVAGLPLACSGARAAGEDPLLR